MSSAKDIQEDYDVFEITDFTTASEWERFISNIEEVLHEWRIPHLRKKTFRGKDLFSRGKTREKSQTVSFANFEFVLSFYEIYLDEGKTADEELLVTEDPEEADEEDNVTCSAWDEMMCPLNDFPSRTHCLSRWFGLQRFLVLSPSQLSEAIIAESRINILLSSICIAVNNAASAIPMFIQVHQRWRKLYFGHLEMPHFRVSFEMLHLRDCPPQYNHLAGLLEVFRLKVASAVEAASVQVSVRLTYQMEDWPEYCWPQPPPDIETGMEIGFKNFESLPFGAWTESIDRLQLHATWPAMSEHMIIDNDVFSDFDPVHAPDWSIKVQMNEHPKCLLNKYLVEFMSLCERDETMEQLLGTILPSESESEIGEVFNRIAKPDVNLRPLSRVVSSKLRVRPEEAPIPEELLTDILQFLFPDARGGNLSNYKLAEHIFSEETKQLKSAPRGSLCYRLASCFCLVYHSLGGIRAVAYLWQEFILEMRFRWENNILIPLLELGSPNLGSCLLHQKLQMLNCCINHKITRDSLVSKSQAQLADKNDRLQRASSLYHSKISADSSDEDEFFECKEEAEMAEGRLNQFGEENLANGLPLFIPITQEPAPMTEDVLEEHAEVLSKLGSSAEGSTLRARMQCACLMSDIESFKAANPGAVLSDFVRWYSPRDWVETSTVDQNGKTVNSGELSSRMKIPGNMWVQVWTSAKAVPVRRQKRLFDHTKEAEKVLHLLAAQKPSDVANLLLPCLMHASLNQIVKEDQFNWCPSHIADLRTEVAKVLRTPKPELVKYQELIEKVSKLEIMITQANSLHARLSAKSSIENSEELCQFIREALSGTEIPLNGGSKGPIGRVINQVFRDSHLNLGEDDEGDASSKFPSPTGKEFILRCMAKVPAPWSRLTPQRMYCTVTPTNFKLAGAFSHDTTFV